MKSAGNKARVERVVATLTRLHSVSDIGTVDRELQALVVGDGDASYKQATRASNIATPTQRSKPCDKGSEWLPLTFKHVGAMQ